MYKKIVSPFLFLFDPESVHNFTFILLKLSFKFPLTKYIVSLLLSLEDPKLEKQINLISSAMKKIEETARSMVRDNDDYMSVCSAMMAVTLAIL